MQVCCISGKKRICPRLKLPVPSLLYSSTAFFLFFFWFYFFLFFFLFFIIFLFFVVVVDVGCYNTAWNISGEMLKQCWMPPAISLSLSLSLRLFILCIIYWMNGESIKSGFQFRVFLLLSWSKRWNMAGIISICGINSKSLAFIAYLNLVINSLRLQTGIRSKFVEYLKTWITP